MTIGLQIFKARDAAGLTQKQLADRLGIRKQTVSDIECERRSISLRMMKRMAAALQTELVIYP